MKFPLFFPVCLTAFALAAPALAAEYKIDPTHSHVGFSVKHLVGKVKGDFREFDGGFSFDPANPSTSSGKFVVKTASVSTDNEKRDAHLKSADFLDASKYPEMTLANIKINSGNGKNKYKLTGDLTLHGVTRPVSFNVEYNGSMKDPWGNQRAGFSASGAIDRTDYGVKWNKVLDAGGLMVGNDVMIDLQVEAVENKPAAKPKAE